MEEGERQKYEAQSQELRIALKQFEADWAQKNGGKKPPREAIKANPIIAQKYKKYNQVRDILDGKIPPPKKEQKQRKRKPDPPPLQTPSKRSRPVTTPSKKEQHIDIIDTFETPSIRRLFSPVVPTSIGPTPQRDGRVLGLFDLLEATTEKTPSRPRHGDATLPNVQIQATPSKRTYSDIEPANPLNLGRTPQSSAKQHAVNNLLTPLKNRDGNIQDARSPSSAGKSLFATPAFLRRAPPPPTDENGLYVSPQPIRLPRKPLVRGLSSVVASLREMEEERLNDDLEALREMEDMEFENGDKPPARPVQPREKRVDTVLEPDSQGHQLLGGFDDEAQFDSEPETQLGRDGQPLRVYKKKGQKRTTRKVNMRPTRAKRPQQLLEEDVPSDIEEGDGQVVAETQIDAAGAPINEEALNLDSSSDFSDNGNRHGEFEKKTKVPRKKSESAKKPAREEKENPIKKAAKKVNAMAHANFKRLKLRNTGSKGGPGFGSRFRRRR